MYLTQSGESYQSQPEPGPGCFWGSVNLSCTWKIKDKYKGFVLVINNLLDRICKTGNTVALTIYFKVKNEHKKILS